MPIRRPDRETHASPVAGLETAVVLQAPQHGVDDLRQRKGEEVKRVPPVVAAPAVCQESARDPAPNGGYYRDVAVPTHRGTEATRRRREGW